MIAFILYAIVFCFLIFYNGFFGLFNDNKISRKTLTVIFFVKLLAVPAFFYLYKIMYGGIDKLDAGKFYHDAVVMNHVFYEHPAEYFKMLFGFQNDEEGSLFFKIGIETTHNWSNGQVKDFFYNDNRVLIRIHSVLHFIAFNSYFVHALFSCFFSFIGLFFIYKAFKDFFQKKETLFLLAICLFPTLWLHTGGLLKEGLTVLFLGLILFHVKKIFSGEGTFFIVLRFCFLLYLSLLVKPYILFYSVVFFSLFFILYRTSSRFKAVLFVGLLAVLSVGINYMSVLVKNKSLLQAALKREREFKDLAKGGIVLLDSTKILRLPYDTTLITPVTDKTNMYHIKAGASYNYWELSHIEDTLYCASHTNATATYSLVDIFQKAGSGIDVIRGSDNLPLIALRSIYYTVMHPLFLNAKGLMQYFASAENLMLILCLLIVLVGLISRNKDNLPAVAFLLFGITVFMIIGFTTPNSGAIMRYRAPAAIFLIMAALYYFGDLKAHFGKNRFKN